MSGAAEAKGSFRFDLVESNEWVASFKGCNPEGKDLELGRRPLNLCVKLLGQNAAVVTEVVSGRQ